MLALAPTHLLTLMAATGAFLVAGGYLLIRLALKVPKNPPDQGK